MTVPVEVRSLRIGEGIPKICAPITGRTNREIRSQAEEIARSRADLAEWRVDLYEMVYDHREVGQTLTLIKELLGEKPVLFTYRTDKEGGNRFISVEDYMKLNIAAGAAADLVDVELFYCKDNTTKLIADIHGRGSRVVCSNHHFTETPDVDQMLEILGSMEAVDADILKIAVMPRDPGDVLRLLDATWKMREKSEKPLITMSMSGQGVLSRIGGESFGSSVTFGTVGQASAPGQLPCDELFQILQILHQS